MVQSSYTVPNAVMFTIHDHQNLIKQMERILELDFLTCCLWCIQNIDQKNLLKNLFRNYMASKYMILHIIIKIKLQRSPKLRHMPISAVRYKYIQTSMLNVKQKRNLNFSVEYQIKETFKWLEIKMIVKICKHCTQFLKIEQNISVNE